MNFQDDIPSIPIDDSKDHYVLVFDLTSMQDATENCHYPEFVGEPLRLAVNLHILSKTLLNSLHWVNECRRLQLTSCCWWKDCVKWINLVCKKSSVVTFCSNFGTLARSPQSMFQFLISTLLLLPTRNPAICRVNIGSWLQTLVKDCILQFILVVKNTVSPSSNMNRWFQNH